MRVVGGRAHAAFSGELLPEARARPAPQGGRSTAEDAGVTPASLAAYVGARLASYKKPGQVILVDEIPRLPSGKALRRVLRDRFIQEAGRGRAAVG